MVSQHAQTHELFISPCVQDSNPIAPKNPEEASTMVKLIKELRGYK